MRYGVRRAVSLQKDGLTDVFLSIGVVILDDIVLPNGQTHMGILGGGAVHAAMGMRLWADWVGVLTRLGGTFPTTLEAQLKEFFLSEGFLRYDALPVLRAWQCFEEDGTRHEVFRVDEVWLEQSVPSPQELPASFYGIQGVHLHCAPEAVPDWVECLRSYQGAILLWEPWDRFCAPQNRARFGELASLVDVVSPNLSEGRALTGLEHPEGVAEAILALGASVVALRMGSAGSLVASADGERLWIPPAPAGKVVDVTGAGNAYCGGFIVGWARYHNLAHAACYGAVSASFALEQLGALYDWRQARIQAEKRLNHLLTLVKTAGS